MSVASEINAAATYTTQMQAQNKTTGAAQKLGSQDFLNLMMKQLQYQDPLAPTSNTEFIAQQAQFSQLETTNAMSSNIANNNGVTQAMSMVGKEVTLTDPEDPKKTITGTVTSASINGKDSAIVVDGKSYPLSSLKTVSTTAPTTTK